MKNMKKLLALVLAVVMVCSMLTACGGNTDPTTATTTQGSENPTTGNTDPTTGSTEPTTTEPAKKLEYKKGTVLRMATGYNNAKTGMSFNAEVAGEGITLADGKTYHAGDLKPTWVEVQNVLGISIEDKYQGR